MKFNANGKNLTEFSGLILETIVGSDTPLTSKEIAEILGVSPRRVPGAIGGIVKANLIVGEKRENEKVNAYSPVEDLVFIGEVEEEDEDLADEVEEEETEEVEEDLSVDDILEELEK
jgi:DNA-binding transcriptional regulator GbsR (MarR family)